MANELRIAAMTAIADMYARALLNEAGDTMNETLKNRLKAVVASNGGKLIPGASLLGFSASFVVLPDVVNETSRDMFLASMAQYLFSLPATNPLYLALKRFTEFKSEDVTAAGNLRDAWMIDAEAAALDIALGDIVQSDSPLYPMATAAFTLVLNALLGEEAYKEVRQRVEVQDDMGSYTSDLFKIHYFAVAFWFTTMTLPLYAVGLLKGDAPAAKDIADAAKAIFDSRGVNAFLNTMGMSWSKNILAVPVGSVDQSVSEGAAPLTESIDVSKAVDATLEAVRNDRSLPPMVDLLQRLDVTGKDQLFIKQLKILTTYYAVNTIIGPGGRVDWSAAHGMIQRALGYANNEEMIKVIFAKGPPLSTSAVGRAGAAIDAETQAKIDRAEQLERDLAQERRDKDEAVKKAAAAVATKKAAYIAFLLTELKTKEDSIALLKKGGKETDD